MISRKLTTRCGVRPLALVVFMGHALLLAATAQTRTANFDKRREGSPGVQLSPNRQQAAAQLQARIPTADIAYDEILGSPHGFLPNGTYKWTPVFLGTGDIDSSPVIGPDGSVYIGSWNNKIYSVNPNTGQINPGWPYTTGSYVRSSPAIAADGSVFVGSDNDPQSPSITGRCCRP
jgi:hypothetical protein